MADLSKTTIWTGKTFEIRGALQAAGAKWEAGKKVWVLPPVAKREVVAIQRLALRAGIEVENAE